MEVNHDELATKVGNLMLEKIRSQDPAWRQVFSSTIHRIGDWEWPRPDYVCQDNVLNATYALEFKPPGQPKREYLTGLGQSLSYLQRHDYAGLIIPENAIDNFKICDFINTTLSSDEFLDICLSLISYDANLINSSPERAIRLVKSIEAKRATTVLHKVKATQTFWSWWRDISNFEIFLLLDLSDYFRKEPGDIYSSKIFDKFWDLMNQGKTFTWEGTPRSKSGTSKKSEKQNYKIPLFHLDLWSQSEGRLTFKGYRLLTIGKIYRPDSSEFLDYLTYLVLVDGKHLELINEVQGFRRRGKIPSASKDFLFKFEQYLDSKGFIGPRKPGRRTTGMKPSYIRDEPKLWNKLKLLESDGRNYFIPGRGYSFNWNRITYILRKDFSMY